MEMHQVRYFLAVCETLNFTRAAEKANVAQPSLTRAIQNLEIELGGSLFRRERHNTHLTDLGRLMRPYFEQILADAQAARSRAKAFAKLGDAPLSVGVMCTLGPQSMMSFFEDFRRAYPGIELHLKDGSASVLKERLEKGDLDLAVLALPDGVGEDFHALPLFTERFVITSAPGHRFEALNAVRLEDLCDERYLSRAACEFADHVRALCAERGVSLIRPYRSERDDWVQSMVRAGLGIGFTPEFSITIPDLVVRPLIEPEIARKVELVTVRGRPHSAPVGAFVRHAIRFSWPVPRAEAA